MKTFFDAAGRPWSISLDSPAVERLRESGIDPGTLEDGSLYLQMENDLPLIGKLFWILCEPQAQLRGVTPEQFGQMLVRCVDAAARALIAEHKAQRRAFHKSGDRNV